MADTSRLPAPVAERWEWQRRGACRDHDVTQFFHEDGERGLRREARVADAVAICARCPVQPECREWARWVEEPYGVWGGESEDHRRAVVAERRREDGGRGERGEAGLESGQREPAPSRLLTERPVHGIDQPDREDQQEAADRAGGDRGDAHDRDPEQCGHDVGARTALRLKGFDVRMLYYANHRRTAGEEASLGVKYARLDTLVAESDVICLALPLMEGSQALFGPERLKAMKPGAWLVNTSRGAIVDRDALVDALESGHLAGYAGDTWYPQPAPAEHPWRSLPAGSEAMTIHCSGMTLEAQDRIAEGVHEMLTAHLDGRPVPDDFVVVDPTA